MQLIPTRRFPLVVRTSSSLFSSLKALDRPAGGRTDWKT